MKRFPAYRKDSMRPITVIFAVVATTYLWILPVAWGQGTIDSASKAQFYDCGNGRSVYGNSAEEARRTCAETARATAKKQAGEKAGQDPNAIEVNMTVGVTSANPPVIMGTTNLPDGSILQVRLKGDLPACFPRCGFMHNTTVENGRFTIGSELTGAEKLIPDSYTIEIVTGPAFGQPHNVQSVIGKSGEHLRGPYVVTLGAGGKYEPAKFPWNPAPSSDEYLSGLMIHYTQRIFVAGPVAPNAPNNQQPYYAPPNNSQYRPVRCVANLDQRDSQQVRFEKLARFKACVNERDRVNDANRMANAHAIAAEQQRQEQVKNAAEKEAHDKEYARFLASVAADEHKNAEIARRTQAHASRALLEYEAKVRSINKSLALAEVAQQCGLRSAKWFQVWLEASALFPSQVVKANQLYLSDDEWIAAQAQTQRDFADARKGVTCQNLLNRSAMDELDRIQWKMTGGYH